MLEINNLDIKFDRTVLKNVYFKSYPGFIHLIRGESGSGKTSLLYRIALLSNQTDYDYYLDNVSVNDMDIQERDHLRTQRISVSLNNACLFEELTVLDNIHIYCMNSDIDYHQFMRRLYIDHLYDQKVKELSGGEYQRLSLVCTLARNKDIIILDEPTSFLDHANEKEVMLLLKEYAKEHNKCIIISSHSQKIIEYCDFIYEIEDKQLNLVLKKEHVKYNKNMETQDKNISCFTLFKYMFKKDMKKLIRIILCLIMSYLSIYGISYILEKMQKTSISQLLEVSDNQVFVTSKDNDIYAKDNDEYLIQTLNLNTKHTIYPYSNLYFMVDDVRVDVLPLFNENDISDQLETEYSIAKNGVILSKNTNQLFYKYQKQSRVFVENIMNGNDIFTYEASIKGILKEGINNYFTNNKYFVYIPYDYLPHNHSEYTGYVLFSETIDDYNQLIEELNSYEIDINTEFINYEDLNKVVDNIRRIKITLYVLSSLATISFCSYLFYHYYNNRNKDYISLLISGMTFKDLKKYFIFEIISIFLITFSMIMPLSLIMLMGGYIEIIDLAIIFAVIIISCILSIVLSTFNLHNLSVEDLLRN